MLNDKMHRQLEKRFGAVKVSNASNRRLERRVADKTWNYGRCGR